jgi:hypothetical protein
MKVDHNNTSQRKTGGATLVSKVSDFRSKIIVIHNEIYFIMIRVSIHQENITILNIYVLNKRFKIHEEVDRTAKRNKSTIISILYLKKL